MLSNNNLYAPVMYLIDKSIKKHFNSEHGGEKEGEYIEGMQLVRDSTGRLQNVIGWEYLDYNLSYKPNGLLDKVDIIQKITGKHVQIRLIFDANNLLIEVEPELMNAGVGDPGYINAPNVTPDYHDDGII